MSELADALKHVDKIGLAAAAAGGDGPAPSAAAAAAPAVVLPRMSEYFGCVTSVPQLSPGEVRAAGVTAHPNVVAAYLRQRDGASLLALQPVSGCGDRTALGDAVMLLLLVSGTADTLHCIAVQ
jgi:hypothetical protein